MSTSVHSTIRIMVRTLLFSVIIALAACNVSEVNSDSDKPDLLEINEKIRTANQANDYRRVDSLLAVVIHKAETTENYEALIDAKTLKASSLFDRNRLKEALEIISGNMKRIEKQGSSLQKMKALIQLSNIHFMQNRNSEGLEALNEASALAPEVEDENAVATVYASRARAIASHDPVEAMKLYYQALEIFTEQNDLRNEAVLRNNIGQIYHRQDKFELALEEYETATKLNREIGNNKELAANYNNISNALSELERYEAATDSLLKSIEINKKLGISPSLIRNYYNLAQIYLDTGEYEEAYSYYSQAYEESNSINFLPGVMFHAIGLADVMLRMKEYSEVQQYIDESRELAERLENLEILARGWSVQESLLEELGDYQGALSASREEQAYSDSLDRIRRDREFEEVRATYEVDLKSAENELLRKELSYQESLSRNQRLLLVVLVAGVLLIAGFLVAIFRNQRKLEKTYKSLKQKTRVISGKNKQLEKLNEELKQLNADKDRLIDIIVHDLRNPLFGVIGFLDVISETVTNKTEKEHLEMARSSAYRLNNLINSLLDVNSLEKNADELDMEKVNLKEPVGNTISNFKEIARKKDITIYNDLISLQVETYPPYLVRILDNLISNAIKFSPLHTHIRVDTKQSGSDTWQLMVTDNGPGLTEYDKERLFQMFGKLSARPTSGEESTGLGLYVVKMLVGRLNGKITVESEEGQGSSFICEFPIGYNGTTDEELIELTEIGSEFES